MWRGLIDHLRRPTLYTLGIGIMIAGVVAAALMAKLAPIRDSEVWTELFKTAIAISVVTGGGLVLAVTLRDRDAKQERQQHEHDVLIQFHKDLIATYNEVKLVRRALRSLGWKSPHSILLTERACDTLRTWQTRLTQAQLELERLKRQSCVQGQLFGEDAARVSSLLSRAEKYLHDGVISEWEREGPAFQSPIHSPPMLEHFGAFLKQDSDEFKQSLSRPMNELRDILAKRLLLEGVPKVRATRAARKWSLNRPKTR